MLTLGVGDCTRIFASRRYGLGYVQASERYLIEEPRDIHPSDPTSNFLRAHPHYKEQIMGPRVSDLVPLPRTQQPVKMPVKDRIVVSANRSLSKPFGFAI